MWSSKIGRKVLLFCVNADLRGSVCVRVCLIVLLVLWGHAFKKKESVRGIHISTPLVKVSGSSHSCCSLSFNLCSLSLTCRQHHLPGVISNLIKPH